VAGRDGVSHRGTGFSPAEPGGIQGFISACFSGTNGGRGLVPIVPTANMRLESASNVLSATSFTLVEVAAGR
jgi:hypothetical protein